MDWTHNGLWMLIIFYFKNVFDQYLIKKYTEAHKGHNLFEIEDSRTAFFLGPLPLYFSIGKVDNPMVVGRGIVH